MATNARPVPAAIGRAHRHDVSIRWQDGHASVYPARALRLACPCAGCTDAMTGQARLVAANVPADVHPVAVRVVGRYAVAIRWSDGHDTGLYAFDALRAMCSCCQGATNQGG